MRWLVAIFLLAAVPALADKTPLLEKAEAAYDAKKYKEAIHDYEQLVEQGYKSPELYFNLGNSYYRNEELGKAIYYYELARKLDPDDEDVKINLGIASAKTIDKIDAKENFLITAVKTNVLSSLSTRSWAWLCIITLALSCLLFFLFVASSSVAAKRTAFVSSCTLFVIFILSYLLGWSALRAKYDNKFAIVLAEELRVMNEPTAGASTKFTLHEGTKIRVLDTNGDWLLLKLDNGNEGWVRMQDVGVI